MDEAHKLQTSTSVVLSNGLGISWQQELAHVALCHQFLTPPDTRQEPRGARLKLLAGFNLESYRNGGKLIPNQAT